MIQRVLSGAQTGVDQAALRAAKACGLETGGYAPLGFLTEAGPMPSLADYGLMEMPTAEYPPRTRTNVEAADATLVLYVGRVGGGTKLAIDCCRAARKPWTAHDLNDRDQASAAGVQCLVAWLDHHSVGTLNVAGPRESRHPGVGALAEAFLVELFAALREEQRP